MSNMKSPESGLGRGIPSPAVYDRIVKKVFAPVIYGGEMLSHPLWSLGHLSAKRDIHTEGMDILQAQEGPYIMSMVHRNAIDPLAMAVAVDRDTQDRRFAMMAKKEIWNTPVVGRLVGKVLDSAGTFPVNRDEPMNQELVERTDVLFGQGGRMGIFHEAHRRDGDLIDRKHSARGVAGIAIRSGVPIIPVGIDGTHKSKRGDISIVVGQPMRTIHNAELAIFEPKTLVRASKPVLDELHESMQAAQNRAIELRESML